MHAASHADLPIITPPASRMRVATVASYVGIQGSPSGSRPLRHRMPAKAMLSFNATRLSARSEDVGAVLLATHLVAQAFPSLSLASCGMVISLRGYTARSGFGKSSSSARRSCTLCSKPPSKVHQSQISSTDSARPAFLRRYLTSSASSFEPLGSVRFRCPREKPSSMTDSPRS